MANKGICVGGPHDGDKAESVGDYFNVILNEHADVKNPDGTYSRTIEYDTYYWIAESKTWRWGTSG